MTAFKANLPLHVSGHLKIVDDLGNVLVDKTNAIHPQNMARIFARALANENNYFINRIAFGNGGTTVDAAFNVIYNTPNDGQSPDIATWDSRLYHETYSEIINAGQISLNPLLGQDLGSADINSGVRTGGGAVPLSDPPSVLHVSGPGVRSTELGLVSEVVISAVLNGNEPLSQYVTDTGVSTDLNTAVGDFVFDEVGLYTAGKQAIPVNGYQYVNVGNRISTDDTGLLPGATYRFAVTINGGTQQIITITTPAAGGSGAGGQILYGDLCQAVNIGDTRWGLTGTSAISGATMSITDYTNGTFPTISNQMTYGYLSVESASSGDTSSVLLVDGTASGSIRPLFASLNPPSGSTLVAPVQGQSAGLQNAPTTPTLERERLLSHLIFSPVLKSANRTIALTYTLTISVARTPH